MNQDRFAGTAQNAAGKLKEGVGKITGNAATQAEGVVDQAMGAKGALRRCGLRCIEAREEASAHTRATQQRQQTHCRKNGANDFQVCPA